MGPAESFLVNIRTPATLLASAAVGMLWVDVGARRGSWLRTLHTLMVAATVKFEFACILITTLSSTRLEAGGYNPMAVWRLFAVRFPSRPRRSSVCACTRISLGRGTVCAQSEKRNLPMKISQAA